MDALYGIPEIMERYGVSRQTASRYIHEMHHMESPRLLAPEWAVEEWERGRMSRDPSPAELRAMEARMKHPGSDFKIPRRRPEAKSA